MPNLILISFCNNLNIFTLKDYQNYDLWNKTYTIMKHVFLSTAYFGQQNDIEDMSLVHQTNQSNKSMKIIKKTNIYLFIYFYYYYYYFVVIVSGR